ncbi:MAG: hypothetical protein IH937_09765 [Acidobacteria bacterium]|nr:hypothetical protein [Acidobacteriota bacterium]
MNKEPIIKSLTALNEIEPIEKLQEEIWGYGARLGPTFPYPGRALLEFVESGGLVAGAYDSRGEIVGFLFAWLGREKPNNRLYLHSQLMGVLAQYRDRGIGFELKRYQRRLRKRGEVGTHQMDIRSPSDQKH